MKSQSMRNLNLARWFFLRFLALIYGVAFLSLWVQVDGLIGEQGILPIARYLEAWQNHFGQKSYFQFPTLCWFNSSDGFLQFLCGGGVVLSILAFFRVAPAAVFFLLWVFYLSLVKAGQDFLSFQWDSLLLETGFLAIFFAPWQLLPRLSRESGPSVLVLWLLRLLTFRLLFSSGVVKLLWHDEIWWNLTALDYHYWSQPLPAWTSWYAHQLPGWFQKTSVFIMFLIEIPLPFLIFFGRRARLVCFLGQIFLQLLILLTGNYGFFNLLTIALCLTLLDDRAFEWFLQRFRRRDPGTPPREQARPPESRFEGVKKTLALVRNALVAAVILFGSGIVILDLGQRIVKVSLKKKPVTRLELPASVATARAFLSRYFIVNGYGLFRVMTVKRPEIVIEGSNDGKEWLAYEFKWKPGDPNRRPGFVQPHMPRLDWQMWFAAMGRFQHTPWVQSLMWNLLRGSPPVLALLEKNPFPDGPPRHVRALLYQYRFTDRETRKTTGAWWQRKLVGEYSPVLRGNP